MKSIRYREKLAVTGYAETNELSRLAIPTHIQTHTHTPTHTHIQTHTHTNTHTHTDTHTYKYTHTQTDTHTQTCTDFNNVFFIFKTKKNVYKRLLQLWLYIKLAQILSVDTKNLDGGRGSAPDPAGELMTLSTNPLVGPKRPGFQ